MTNHPNRSKIGNMIPAVQAKEDLEALIDRNGLRIITLLLAEICHEKAEHIESNRQDKTWTRAAKEFERVTLALPSALVA
jgi:hypothetical protein